MQIKNWRQPSNPLKISYPLVHPSFFRRHGFRWLETAPELTDRAFIGTYGRPLDVAEGCSVADRRHWLKEQGILQDGWFYTERIEARDHEADELIKIMGIGAVPERKPAGKPKRQERTAGYDPQRKYETERGMGLRFEDMELPDPESAPFDYPEDDLPGFSPEDLRLPPEALFLKLQKKRGWL